jgi:hypothetical protein
LFDVDLTGFMFFIIEQNVIEDMNPTNLGTAEYGDHVNVGMLHKVHLSEAIDATVRLCPNRGGTQGIMGTGTFGV